MIFIKKTSQSPAILTDSQERLDEMISNYGSIENIPDDDKNPIIQNYNHRDVKEVLFNCSHNKCAYCEIICHGGYLEVEHFFPKSRYPELILNWDNLLPSCKQCNLRKSSHDTGLEPIINPCNINPEHYLDYGDLKIYPSENSPDYELAERTIYVCDLNRPELVDARISILVDLINYERVIEEKLEILKNSITERESKIRLVKLKDNIELIERHTKETEMFSGLCRNFMKKSRIIKDSKKYIEEILEN